MTLRAVYQEICAKKIFIFFSVWILMLLGGISLLTWYSNKAGATGNPPESLSATVPVTDRTKPYQLLMFVHPRCSCTHASIRELKRLLTHCSESVSCTFFSFLPSGETEEWAQSGILKSINDLPDVKVLDDINGEWATAFGVRTSGHILLYDSEQKLRFSGGITISRGHEGTSRANSILAGLITDRVQSSHSYPTFGCPILN